MAANVKPCLRGERLVVGLGANLGEPERTFRRAALECRAFGRVVAGSRLYIGARADAPR